MSIPADRLREIADGAMGIGAPLVLTQAEQVEVCTELLALRDAMSLPGYTRLVEERDAAVAKCAELERERAYYKLVSEGWSDAEARGEVWPAAAEQGGA